MSNYNKVLLMGRVTRDPELRCTPQGTPVTELGLAVNREYVPSQGGERRKETTFVDVTFWSRRAEVICQYFKKGDPIFIEGRLTMSTWETPDGQKRNRLRVTADNFEFISPRGDRSSGPAESRGAPPGEYSDYQYPGAPGDAPPARPAGGAGAGGDWGANEGQQNPDGAAIDDSQIPF